MRFLVIGLLFLWTTLAIAAPGDLIGPSISDELEAAGLMGLPFSWRPSDGTVRTDDPRLTDLQREAIISVFAAHSRLTLSKAEVKAAAKERAKKDWATYCLSLTLTPTEKTLCAVLSE